MEQEPSGRAAMELTSSIPAERRLQQTRRRQVMEGKASQLSTSPEHMDPVSRSGVGAAVSRDGAEGGVTFPGQQCGESPVDVEVCLHAKNGCVVTRQRQADVMVDHCCGRSEMTAPTFEGEADFKSFLVHFEMLLN